MASSGTPLRGKMRERVEEREAQDSSSLRLFLFRDSSPREETGATDQFSVIIDRPKPT